MMAAQGVAGAATGIATAAWIEAARAKVENTLENMLTPTGTCFSALGLIPRNAAVNERRTEYIDSRADDYKTRRSIGAPRRKDPCELLPE